MKRLCGLLSLSLILSGCSAFTDEQSSFHDETPVSSGWIYGKYLEAMGVGIEDPSLQSATQRKAMARDAAVVNAQYELLALVKRLKTTDGVSLEQSMQNIPKLKKHVEETIQGAQILRTEYSLAGQCRVTIRLPKSWIVELVGGLAE